MAWLALAGFTVGVGCVGATVGFSPSTWLSAVP